MYYSNQLLGIGAIGCGAAALYALSHFFWGGDEVKELSQLPNELIGVLVQDLSVLDCVSASKVCKQWHQVITSDFLNEKLLDHAIFRKKNWLQLSNIKDVSDDPILTIVQKANLITWLKAACHSFNRSNDSELDRGQRKAHNQFWQKPVLLILPKKINEKPGDLNHILKTAGFKQLSALPDHLEMESVKMYSVIEN